LWLAGSATPSVLDLSGFGKIDTDIFNVCFAKHEGLKKICDNARKLERACPLQQVGQAFGGQRFLLVHNFIYCCLLNLGLMGSEHI